MITGLLIKPKQQRDSLVNFLCVRACNQGWPRPPSINFSQSQRETVAHWHNCSTAKTNPTLWCLGGVTSRVDTWQLVAEERRSRRSSVRHVDPVVNRSCKMEPRRRLSGSYKRHKSTISEQMRRKHHACTGERVDKGVTHQPFHYGSTINA